MTEAYDAVRRRFLDDGWLQICAEGKHDEERLTSYLDALYHAWAEAEKSAPNDDEAFNDCLRYALIRDQLRARLSGVPSILAAKAVELEVWSAQWAEVITRLNADDAPLNDTLPPHDQGKLPPEVAEHQLGQALLHAAPRDLVRPYRSASRRSPRTGTSTRPRNNYPGDRSRHAPGDDAAPAHDCALYSGQCAGRSGCKSGA